MKDDLRAKPEDYEQLAKRCVELASECSEPTVAEALRALAVEYLRRAAKLRRRGSVQSLQSMSLLRQAEDHREGYDQQDGDASKREDAAIKGVIWRPPMTGPHGVALASQPAILERRCGEMLTSPARSQLALPRETPRCSGDVAFLSRRGRST